MAKGEEDEKEREVEELVERIGERDWTKERGEDGVDWNKGFGIG